MNHVLATVLLVLLGAAGVLSVGAVAAAESPEPLPATQATITVDQVVDGKTAVQWHGDFIRMRRLAYARRRRILQLEATFRHQPTVSEALNLACTVYGHCAELWRKARCESHLYRFAQNRSSYASGLMQFLPSTWRSTPFAGFSIFSAYANALAGGWMHAHGRGGEWVCR